MVHLDQGKEIELWIEANVPVDKKLDCWLFLMLPVCMMLDEDLEVSGTISQTAINAFYNAQEELLEGHPHLKKIKLTTETATVETSEIKKASGIGSFFSGGLDSTYTAETVKDIDTLIGVWGFDISVTNEKHWKLTQSILEELSAGINKKLVTVKTNIRALSNGLLSWGRDYHGPAMAGIAIALSNHVSKVYVSASHIEETKRWGQFPSLSRSFSTEHQDIIEHGALVRTEKALSLGKHPSAKRLRVCYRNKTDRANCGECQKCLRTRLEFSLINSPFRPKGLETQPSLLEIMKIKILKNDFAFFKNSIYWARDAGYQKTLLPLMAISLARLNSIIYYYRYPEKKSKN
jgi:7-cyano-7-deazaguanine synthase in queuosine biosynthesis